MKLRRFISILLGLALIGLLGYRFYEVDMNAGHEYLAGVVDLPDLANKIILYALPAVMALAILFVAIGSKGTLIAAVFFMIIGFANKPLIDIEGTKDIFNAVISGDLFQMELPEMFETLLLPLIILFWLIYTIFVIFGATKSASAKIILLLVGIAPLALYFADGLLITKDYAFDLDATMDLVLSHGVVFLMAVMLLFNQRKPKRASKHTWFPVRETLQ